MSTHEQDQYQFFSCTEIPDGYSWTLTSRLGNMLVMTEKLFGPRDKEWTILGVEFVSSSTSSRVWYPGNCKHIAIQLTASAKQYLNQALYQLAHEVVHCLTPVERGSSTVLEEGLAVWFARYYMKKTDENYPSDPCDPSYIEAETLVRQLLDHDCGIIKEIRKSKQCRISDILEQDLTSEGISPELAAALCQKF